MTDKMIKSKIIVCSSLILFFMFIHITTIISNCENQVNQNTSAISAFNG